MAHQSKDEALLLAREEAALEQLKNEGWTVGVHETRRFVEPDPLRDIEGGWRAGICVATIWSTDGRTKNITGVSAVHVLDQAKVWTKYQANLEPPMRFEPVRGETVAVPVIQKVGGDTATTAARRAATERRVLSFASGAAEVVDERGAPIEEDRASQFRGA